MAGHSRTSDMAGRSGGAVVADAAGLALAPVEAEVLAADAAAFAGALRDATAQDRYLRLASAAAAGAVPADLLPALETMLELLFEKGRPSNRAILQTIFARTPRGRQQSAAAREVNTALRSLRGQRLEEFRLAATPRGHTLTIETDRCRLTLELDSAGARVGTLETG
jgi:hypothetical protein